jgi:hypothetical protein
VQVVPFPSLISPSLSMFLSSDTKDTLPNCSSLVDPKSKLTMVSEHGLEARSLWVEKKSRKTNPSSSQAPNPRIKKEKRGKSKERTHRLASGRWQSASPLAAPVPLDSREHPEEARGRRTWAVEEGTTPSPPPKGKFPSGAKGAPPSRRSPGRGAVHHHRRRGADHWKEAQKGTSALDLCELPTSEASSQPLADRGQRGRRASLARRE